MDDAQAPDVPGYEVGRLLGRGGSADVWLAREQRTGQEYALKSFRPAGSGTRSSPGITEEEVQREIRILSVLDHQHLIRVHDAVQGTEPGSGTTLTMDYAAGGSLAQLVSARGRLSVGETVTVLTPIAQALAYLHGKGFTHSDVSPGNVLFTGQGKPMLSDLGVARMIGDPGCAGTAGTGGFLDPAPVDAVRAGLQPERDVYSVAALGWFCLTGEAPGRTADRPPLSLLVPGVPKDLAAALEAGLNDERRLRPDALALATAVYRSAEPQPVDLSDAVHPTVLPELLTRRPVPAESKRSALRTKVQGLRRRAATSRWSARQPQARRSREQPTPARQPQVQPSPASNGTPSPARDRTGPGVKAAVESRGKHADGPVGGQARRVLLRSVLPLIAAVAAVAWWLSTSAGDGMWLRGAAQGLPPTSAPSAGAGAGVGADADSDGGKGLPLPVDTARRRAGAADPVEAVQGLAALRDYAFSSGGVELLADVNAPGSAAAAADQRVAGRVAGSGQRLTGFTTTLSEIAAEDGGTEARAVVRAVSATSGYRLVDAGDTVVATGAPTRPQLLRLVLVSVEGRWLVADILPGP
ncbi:serine/threonine protein kinase [Arthrobacter sp. DNA4]|uniref:serine/threonine-protein kinase n=1 Tax=Arthrobacter sp. DNA4 TaxID=2963432 RepID=UPI0020CBA98D|nr:serine/threonine-protein kinase [Arthrobacter sp. DNA4]UTT71076.1 serine/threonine protein kinase [Arthrobacter sp. DNA4]